MAGKTTYFKIGLFVIVGTILLVGGVVVLGLRSTTAEPLAFETYFEESVQGLSVGSPVKQRGVPIGSVTDIGFVDFHYEIPPSVRMKQKGRPVYVRMDINPSYAKVPPGMDLKTVLEQRTAQGLRTRLVSQGITGLVFVEVDVVDPKENPPMELSWAPKAHYLPSAASTGTRLIKSVDEILGSLGEIDFKAIGADIEKLLTTTDKAVADLDVALTTGDIHAILEETKESVARVREILDKPEIDAIVVDAKETMASLKKAAAEVEPLLAETSAAVKDLSGELEKLLASEAVHRLVDEAPGVVVNLRRLLQRVDRLIAANQESVTSLLRNFRQITLSVEKVTTNAEDYPSVILFGETPPATKLEPAEK